MMTKNKIAHFYLIFNLVFIFLSFTVKAQFIQKNSGTTNNLYDVHFPTADTGYAVGYKGTILKTIDAGETWFTLNSNTLSDIQTVHFLNANTGFAAGDSGIFKTTNGGINWSYINVPTSQPLNDLYFLNNQSGFCVGNGVILKTNDGGSTWIVKPSGNVAYNFTAVHFPVADTGYVVAGPSHWIYLRTINAGETWDVFQIDSLSNPVTFETVFFTDANTGYFGGWYGPTLIKTNDSGNNWIDKDLSGLANLYSLHFPSPSVGFGVGWHSTILKTIDNGNTWHPQISGVSNKIFYAVYFTNDTTGYIVGESGIILKTTKGGDGFSDIKDYMNHENIIMLYPNPVNNELSINIKSTIKHNVSFTLYSSFGEAMITKQFTQKKNTIDLSDYANGIYFFRLQVDNKLEKSGKIIKQ